MSEKIDIQEIKRNADIVQVIGRHVSLKRDGIHWIGKCPFHDEKTESFKVTPSKNMFKCFGCGEQGDVFDFFTKQGKTLQEAIREVSDPFNTAAIQLGVAQKNESFKKESEKPKWEQIIPGIKQDGMFKHYKHGNPTMTWDYLNAEGLLIGCVCRFDLPTGKEVLPLIYATDGRVKKWVFKGFDKPRPLYGLQRLYKHPLAPVLVVEGEKTADAAQKLFPNSVVITWMGGGQGVKYADWFPLKDRMVVLWPDNDQPGFDAMHQVYEHIHDIAETVKWVLNPNDVEKGWDLADSEWTPDYAKQYASTNIIDYPGSTFRYDAKNTVTSLSWEIGVMNDKSETKGKKAKKEKEAPVEEKKSSVTDSDIPPNENDPDGFPLLGGKYFRMLGAQKEGNGMIFYFYAFSTKTVIGLSPSAMSKNNLLQLAPLNWWKNTFPSNTAQQVFSVEQAANYLINKSSEFGTFSEKWIRGRGAWIDNKRVVIHAGDKLLINGVETALSNYESRFIYEIGEELGFSVSNPLKNKESVKFIELLKKLNWDRPINAYLLAGWCVVAPVCGALSWRPHIWLTGAAGTGKSYVFRNVVRAVLGEVGLALEGETSEAGVRQTLNHDALPVVFDEAEGEDRKAQDRMQSVLALMRVSSSSDGGVVAKGSAGGSAKTYRIRSCFAFASIAVQLAQQSDRTRVSVLGLRKAMDADAPKRWAEFQEMYASLITEEYCNRLRARTISILPTILENIKTFSAAAAATIGEQRSGDQIGVLLAGAYSLVSDKKINYKEAVEWVADKDWDEEKGLGSTRDEVALISHILEWIVRVETERATVERNIGELVLIALGLRAEEWNINKDQANERLKRCGIKVKDDHVFISNSDRNVQQILHGTAWARNHHKILLRLENATAVTSERFASGVSTRAVKISKETLFPGFVPEVVSAPVAPIEQASNVGQFHNQDIFAQGSEDDPF